MKKLMKQWIVIGALVAAGMLTGCEQRNQFQEAVLKKMQQDSDVTDYKLAPDDMTKCVVDKVSRNMPGLFPLDPRRLEAYQHYQQMLDLPESENPQQTLNDLRTVFGSPQALADAHRNYAKGFMDCLTELIAQRDQDLTERLRPGSTAKPPNDAPSQSTPIEPKAATDNTP